MQMQYMDLGFKVGFLKREWNELMQVLKLEEKKINQYTYEVINPYSRI